LIRKWEQWYRLSQSGIAPQGCPRCRDVPITGVRLTLPSRPRVLAKPPLLLPNAIKAAWAQLHILRRVADCLVSEVELDFAQVAAFIS